MGTSAEAANEELQALKQEVVIMRDRLEHHPEVKRFAGMQPKGLSICDLVHATPGPSCCNATQSVERHINGQ